MTNGTSTPAGPGCSQRSPSSVIACTAMATRPTSAACSCAATIALRSAGRLGRRPAIASPRPTARLTRTSATTPGGAAREPPGVVHGIAVGHAATSRGRRTSGSTPPSSWTSTPPPRRRMRARGRRARQERRLRERLGQDGGRRERGGGRQPGPGRGGRSTGRSGGARGRRPLRQTRAPRPEVATAPRLIRNVHDRAAAERRGDLDGEVRAAAGGVAAAVDGERAVRRQPFGEHVGAQALRRAAEVESQTWRAADGAVVVDDDLAPAAGRVRGRRPARRAAARAVAAGAGLPARDVR